MGRRRPFVVFKVELKLPGATLLASEAPRGPKTLALASERPSASAASLELDRLCFVAKLWTGVAEAMVPSRGWERRAWCAGSCCSTRVTDAHAVGSEQPSDGRGARGLSGAGAVAQAAEPHADNGAAPSPQSVGRVGVEGSRPPSRQMRRERKRGSKAVVRGEQARTPWSRVKGELVARVVVVQQVLHSDEYVETKPPSPNPGNRPHTEEERRTDLAGQAGSGGVASAEFLHAE